MDGGVTGPSLRWANALTFANNLASASSSLNFGIQGLLNGSALVATQPRTFPLFRLDDALVVLRSERRFDSQWRLPNVRELQSLIDYGEYNPALPTGHPFTGVASSNV